MKQITMIALMLFSMSIFAQTNAKLKNHFETYYQEMKKQGDIQGIISAMTHLNILEPSVARKDTLAYLYLSEGLYRQALNTIGIDEDTTGSDISVEVKALALKNINQPKMSLKHYEILYKRKPNSYLAYEIADLKIQVNDLVGAKTNIEYGLTYAKDDMKRAFYETQQPYETSLKAAFTYLKGVLAFSENKTNIDIALNLMNDALSIDPNFNLAKISRQALEKQKAQNAQKANNTDKN